MKYLAPLALFILVISLQASAISVVSDFLENDTLVLKEHESKLYGIRIQNGKDYSQHFRVTYDGEYATILDYKGQYEVPPKSSVSIKFNLSSDKMPKGEPISIGYSVHELSGAGEGVPILLSINKNFNVKVEESGAEPNINPINPEVLAVLAIILLYLAYRACLKSKTQKNKRKKKFL
jgi:hypothetical protein